MSLVPRRRAWRAPLSIVLASLALALTGRSAKYGRLPAGERLARVELSPNYRDGEFRNQALAPPRVGDRGRFASLWRFLRDDAERLKPAAPLPMAHTDSRSLARERDWVVWLGRSSVYAQLGGKRILIDPVFSDHAAPFFFLNRAFVGERPFRPRDAPDIDYLLISHDRWDHLDYPTPLALKPKIGTVVRGLGVGAHLERWGFSPSGSGRPTGASPWS